MTAGTIETLVGVQEIDSRHRSLLQRIADCQAELESKEIELAGQRASVEAMRSSSNAAATRRRELEALILAKERSLKDGRMRIDRIRNERELDAAQREIESLKEGLSRHEEELLGVFEQSETTDAALGTEEAALAASETDNEALTKRAHDEIAELQKDIATDSAERERLAGLIQPALRQEYEKIRQRRAGLAVAQMRDGSCMGCRMRLRPQLANDLLRGEAIQKCPGCNRFLFHRDETADAAASG